MVYCNVSTMYLLPVTKDYGVLQSHIGLVDKHTAGHYQHTLRGEWVLAQYVLPQHCC